MLVLNQSLMEQAEALRVRNRRLTEQLNMQEARIVREVTFNQQLQVTLALTLTITLNPNASPNHNP